MDKNAILDSHALNELALALSATDDPCMIHDFLRGILTEYELDEVAKRWALVRLIDEGRSQRAIAKQLGVSLCKITRGSKELKKDGSSFAWMISRYKQLSDNTSFAQKIGFE